MKRDTYKCEPDLSKCTENGSATLCHEKATRWNFEVMSEFHVLGEVESLAHDVRREDFEKHVCEWFSVEEVAAYEFCEDV